MCLPVTHEFEHSKCCPQSLIPTQYHPLECMNPVKYKKVNIEIIIYHNEHLQPTESLDQGLRLSWFNTNYSLYLTNKYLSRMVNWFLLRFWFMVEPTSVHLEELHDLDSPEASSNILFSYIMKQRVRKGCCSWYNRSFDGRFLKNISTTASLRYIFHHCSGIVGCLWLISGRTCTLSQFLHFTIVGYCS